MKTSSKISSTILCAGFAFIISIPLVFTIIGARTGFTTAENRRAQRRPSLEIPPLDSVVGVKAKGKEVYLAHTAFIRRFNNYFSTTFSFRLDLLRLYSAIKIDMLNTEPLPQKVVHGLDGWFFLGDEYSNVIKESKGLENFPADELNSVTLALEKNKNWLNEKNIEYYFAIAPNKLSVYGQFLPIQKADRPTTADQLKIASSDKFNLVDLKSEFGTTPSARLYYKTDSHWNDYGAFLGYTSLMKSVVAQHPEIPILSRKEFSIDTSYSQQQELTRMLAIMVKEEVITFKPTYREKATLQKKQLSVPKNYPRPPDDYERRYQSDVNDLKVLILHDSFTTHMVKFIKESFGETVFIWSTKFDRALIEKEKPDLVVQIIVERNLDLAGK